MASTINVITFWPDATGYTGIINGQPHHVTEPQQFLDVANERWPNLLFKLELHREVRVSPQTYWVS